MTSSQKEMEGGRTDLAGLSNQCFVCIAKAPDFVSGVKQTAVGEI